jgi:hypothetical protein
MSSVNLYFSRTIHDCKWIADLYSFNKRKGRTISDPAL